jgi:acetyltransferase
MRYNDYNQLKCYSFICTPKAVDMGGPIRGKLYEFHKYQAPIMISYGVASGDESRHNLDCFFAPRSVAVIGASERAGSVGRTIFWNLISSPFGGTVYAVNPHHDRVLGIRTLKTIQDAPEAVDLALIVTPAATVPSMLDACMAAHVPGAIIISADYSPEGAPSAGFNEEIRARVRSGKIRIIGPNSLGLMNPAIGLNAAYASGIALKGTVGFISQSGALCASILDWSLQVKMGFSAFVSFGQMMDVGWSELIYYLGNDTNTKSIVIYMESLGNARAFISAAREVALSKPIIILKTGGERPELFGAPQASYWEASDTDNDEVLTAALARSGVLRVSSMDTLFSMAEALGKQPRPKGPRLTIISNAAGPAVLAADALISEGGELAALSGPTKEALDAMLPAFWKPMNPIDLLPDASPERYKSAVQAALQDENSDGLLVLLAPQVATQPTATAKALAGLERSDHKPMLASWMGGNLVEEGIGLLNERLVSTFPYPDQAARIFASMWRYSYAVRGLYETPEPQRGDALSSGGRAAASQLVAKARAAGQTHLSSSETAQLLSAYGISCAEEPGAGALDTISPSDTTACPLFLAAKMDEQFGPYIVFGTGGPHSEILRDYAYALPPLNTTLARRAMEKTRIYSALKTGVNLGLLEQVLIGFSNLILNERWIRSIVLNPLVASASGVSALHAHIELHTTDMTADRLPQPAIRPYPVEYCNHCTLHDGTKLILRPIRPEDETLMINFHKTLSGDSVYFHYLRLLSLDQRIRHERISQLCFIDYDRQIGLVAEHTDPKTGEQSILALARLVRIHGSRAGDFALIVNDRAQGRGLGKTLLKHLLDVAAAENICPVVGIIHPENQVMLTLCRKLGFKLSKPVGEAVRAEYITE